MLIVLMEAVQPAGNAKVCQQLPCVSSVLHSHHHKQSSLDLTSVIFALQWQEIHLNIYRASPRYEGHLTSARMNSASLSTRSALSVMSSRLPMGVATT